MQVALLLIRRGYIDDGCPQVSKFALNVLRRLALFGKSNAPLLGLAKKQDDESDLGYFSHRYLKSVSLAIGSYYPHSSSIEQPQQMTNISPQ
ncbi:hypothetical protein ACODM8_18640 [Vibrio ostreicida]|uniref:hypothetical protein n=1 Tax=Vibrio ostreicida TaxID=526588 RepID=UPI003B590B6E